MSSRQIRIQMFGPACLRQQKLLNIFGLFQIRMETLQHGIGQYYSHFLQVAVFPPALRRHLRAPPEEATGFLQSACGVKPHFRPCLHIFRRAVLALRRHKSDVAYTEQRRSSRSAKAHHHVGCRHTPHSGIRDGSAFAQQQECRVPFGNVEHLLELTPVLRQIDDTVILLHYPGMF